MVPIKDAIAVAINTACASIPDADKILGFTARMYAMVIKVVTPATTSVRTFVPFSFSLKNFSNITISIPFVVVEYLCLYYIQSYLFNDFSEHGLHILFSFICNNGCHIVIGKLSSSI